MKIKDFIRKLKIAFTFGAKDSSKKLLQKEESKIIRLLKEHSAKDTGEFRSNWKVKRGRFNAKNTLAGISITNDTPKYGQFVAFGAEPREAPWYYPHRDAKTGRFKKGTGKLKTVEGKVWAGGLNPGHDKTVGGPIAIVLSKYTENFTEEFADGFVKGFI